MITGTCHFVSLETAKAYYHAIGIGHVDLKIASGEILIGKPPLKEGETLGLCDNEQRYTITTKN